MKFVYRTLAASLVMWMAGMIAQNVLRRRDVRSKSRKIDEMLLDSFPSSDPPSSWGGVD